MPDAKRLRRRHPRRWAAIGAVVLLVSVLAAPAGAHSQAGTAQSFDLDTGDALEELIFATTREPERELLSASGADITLITHYSLHLALAWFDAIAPYHPTAVGIVSDLGRRPPAEATNRNKNTAIIYAAYRVLNELMPQAATTWRDMMISVGLDPDDDQENTQTAIGLGNLAARNVIESRKADGMNRLGDEGGGQYNRQRYADYTGYEPVNTAYELRNPSRWQPNIVENVNGTFEVQQFVTPQTGLVEPLTYDDPSQFHIAPPRNSNHHRRAAYRRQADEVIAASAALTDRQKMTAELFNDKILALGFVGGTAAGEAGNLDLDGNVQYAVTTSLANFESAIMVWHYKMRYDAVRPFSAIQYLYGDEQITAWGGPGKGTVDDITGNEWQSYLDVADHPEYPSASTAACHAYSTAARLFLGSDEIDVELPYEAGSSLVEPGITPATDLTLTWDSWTDFAADCGISRFWAGVHFLSSIENVIDAAEEIGELSYEFVQQHIQGQPVE